MSYEREGEAALLVRADKAQKAVSVSRADNSVAAVIFEIGLSLAVPLTGVILVEWLLSAAGAY